VNQEKEHQEKYHGWHLDKRVSVGHLATTLVVVATFVIWLMNMNGEIQLVKKDVSRNAYEMAEIKLADQRHERDAAAALAGMEGRMDAQSKRLEGRMEAQYNEIIRRLEILDQRMMDSNNENLKAHKNGGS